MTAMNWLTIRAFNVPGGGNAGEAAIAPDRTVRLTAGCCGRSLRDPHGDVPAENLYARIRSHKTLELSAWTVRSHSSRTTNSAPAIAVIEASTQDASPGACTGRLLPHDGASERRRVSRAAIVGWSSRPYGTAPPVVSRASR